MELVFFLVSSVHTVMLQTEKIRDKLPLFRVLLGDSYWIALCSL
jgi:hypothetical protein